MKKILIVDDEPNIVMSLEYIFKKEVYEVFIARDGAEAIEIVENNEIDLIVLDIMMPNVDGFQVLNYLKANPVFSTIKVIFLTAKNKASDIALGLQLGADKYVSKPFSTKKLVIEVKELLNKK